MTVRVLKPATEWQIECSRCGSTLAYSPIDIKEFPMDGGRFKGIDCPICHADPNGENTFIFIPDESDRVPVANDRVPKGELIEFLDILEANKYRVSIDPTRRFPGSVFSVQLRKGTADLCVTIREVELSTYSGMDLCILATLKELKEKLDLKLEATSKRRSVSE